MSVQPASMASSARYDRVQAERWLLLARGLWITLLALTLAISLNSFPDYLAQLHSPCTGATCQYQQLTFSQVQVLAGIGLSLDAYAALTVALLIAGLIACWAVSALIVWRRPGDRMAFLVALMLVTLGPLPISTALPGGPFPLRAPHDYLIALAQVLPVIVFFLFPSGRFASRWTRWVFVALLIGQAIAFFLPDRLLLDYTTASQPGWLVAVAEMATAAGVQIYRYRWVSSPIERQQTKWVVLGLALPIVTFVAVTVLSIGLPALAESNAIYIVALNEFEFLLPLFVPLSFGFAILRYRLWDIDLLINRTLVYGALTLVLTAVFVGLVIALQALLGGVIGQDNRVAVVISTLAIAALSQPARKRLQTLIDRRFYRHKYDMAKTMDTFNSTLSHEMDLETLHEQVLALVLETMQPAHATLWLRSPQPPSARDESAHMRLRG